MLSNSICRAAKRVAAQRAKNALTSSSQLTLTTPKRHTASSRPSATTLKQLQHQSTSFQSSTFTPNSNPTTIKSINEASLALTALTGALISTTTYYILDNYVLKQKKIPQLLKNNTNSLTFDQIQTILASDNYLPEDIINGDIDIEQVKEETLKRELEAPVHRYTYKEIAMDDYVKIMAIDEEVLPLPQKIDTLRTLLLQQLEDTEPLFNLIVDKVDAVNNALIERIYYQFVEEAKLVNRTHGRALSHDDINTKMQWDLDEKLLTPQILNQLKQLLYFMRQHIINDYPSIDQCYYLTDEEINAAYQKLCQVCMDSCDRMPYFKLITLSYDLENSIDYDPNSTDPQQLKMQERLDTVVTKHHNTLSNAFTDTLDRFSAFDLKQKIKYYREKALDIVTASIVDIDFFIDSIDQINELIKKEIKSSVYKVEQQRLQFEADEAKAMLNAQKNLTVEQRADKLAEIESTLGQDLDFAKLDKTVEELYNEQQLHPEHLIPLQKTYHDSWVRLTYCDPPAIEAMHETELEPLLGAIRQAYLDAKEKEFIPMLYLTQYGIEKPLDYNPLYNNAYLMREETHALDRPVAEKILSHYAMREMQIAQDMEDKAKGLDNHQ